MASLWTSDDNLSKCQEILTKLGIDIKKIWFGIANGQILSIFVCNTIMLGYYHFTVNDFKWFLTLIFSISM